MVVSRDDVEYDYDDHGEGGENNGGSSRNCNGDIWKWEFCVFIFILYLCYVIKENERSRRRGFIGVNLKPTLKIVLYLSRQFMHL